MSMWWSIRLTNWTELRFNLFTWNKLYINWDQVRQSDRTPHEQSLTPPHFWSQCAFLIHESIEITSWPPTCKNMLWMYICMLNICYFNVYNSEGGGISLFIISDNVLNYYMLIPTPSRVVYEQLYKNMFVVL